MFKRLFLAFIVCFSIFPGACGHFFESNDYVDFTDFAVDKDGFIYVTGWFPGRIDFSIGANKMVKNAGDNVFNFAARYDPDNNLDWVLTWEQYEVSHSSEGPATLVTSLTVDHAGDLYISGIFKGKRDLDFTDGVEERESSVSAQTGSNQIQSAYLTKIDSAGNFKWVRTWGNQEGIFVKSLILTDPDVLSVSGTYDGSTDFDPGPEEKICNSSGPEDFFISRFDPDGNFLSVTTWAGDIGQFEQFVIKQSGDGNLIFAGTTRNPFDIQPGPGEVIIKPAAEWCAIFAAELDPTGQPSSVVFCDFPYSVRVRDVINDESGNFYITGDYSDYSSPLASQGRNSAAYSQYPGYSFLIKLNRPGSLEWERIWGGERGGEGASVLQMKTDSTGNVIVFGTFYGTIDFDPGDGVNENSAPVEPFKYYSSVFKPDGSFDKVEIWEFEEQPDFPIFSDSLVRYKMTADILIQMRYSGSPSSLYVY